MPEGFGLPVGVDGTGGVAVLDGVAQDDKIVRMALADNSSNNAFQQGIGFGIFPVFSIDDAETRIGILQRVREIFRAFVAEERFKLREETLKFTNDKQGELVLEFKYLSLRADQERTFSATITPGGFSQR
ncbi:hypothetical protein LCGC14_1315800 [marine sediment metagenome]|uniref:IraD/Gp25-like domain-containing protein n=1 Tax=marine sediment metagenome TaxID=412755 RepID=A0A0F9N1X3_9ZZZZ